MCLHCSSNAATVWFLQVNCEQEVTWLAPCYYSVLTADEMTNWIDTDEVQNFSTESIIEKILSAPKFMFKIQTTPAVM